MTPFRRILLSASAWLCTAALSLSASAQTYPSKPITLVVPFAAGGPTDVVARLLGSSMSRTLGQTVVIENKLGAGGTIAANAVRQAAPDGYTFLIHHNGMGTAPALYRKLPFNPLTDFEYVSQVVDVPMTLIGRRDFPPGNFRELVEYLRVHRDRINVAHAGLGAVSHLCSMLLRQAIGTPEAEKRAVRAKAAALRADIESL